MESKERKDKVEALINLLLEKFKLRDKNCDSLPTCPDDMDGCIHPDEDSIDSKYGPFCGKNPNEEQCDECMREWLTKLVIEQLKD